jgi:hypothetical protein
MTRKEIGAVTVPTATYINIRFQRRKEKSRNNQIFENAQQENIIMQNAVLDCSL